MKITLNTIRNINSTNLNQNDKVKNSSKQSQNLGVEDNDYTYSKETSSALKNNVTFGIGKPPFYNSLGNNTASAKNITMPNVRITPEMISSYQQRARRKIIDKLKNQIENSDLNDNHKQALAGVLTQLDYSVAPKKHTEIIDKFAFINLLFNHLQTLKQNDEENLKLVEHCLTPAFILNNTFFKDLSGEIHISNTNGGVQGFKIGTMEKEIGNINKIIVGVNQRTKQPEFTVSAKTNESLTNIYTQLDDDKTYEVKNINTLFVQYPIEELYDCISIYTVNHENIIVNNREFRGSATLKNNGLVDLS